MFSGRELSNHLFNEVETETAFVNHMLLDATGNPAENIKRYPIFRSVSIGSSYLAEPFGQRDSITERYLRELHLVVPSN